MDSISVPSDVHKLYHSCSGKSCKFCECRRQNPISLGWESLFEPGLHKAKPGKPISYDEEFVVNEEVIKALEEIEYIEASPEHSVNATTTCTGNNQPGINPKIEQKHVYSSPKSQAAIEEAAELGIPEKTRQSTKWAVGVWEDWAKSRNRRLLLEEKPFNCSFEKLSKQEMNFWRCRFVLEVWRHDGNPYPPLTLYQLCCGLLRYLRMCGHAEVNILDQAEFHKFKTILDSEIKRLNGTGLYTKKRQAECITSDDEDQLWDLGLLGDDSPTVLLHTLVYMCGFYFALRSGEAFTILHLRLSLWKNRDHVHTYINEKTFPKQTKESLAVDQSLWKR